jgi:probable rRNA maturation factor
VRQRSIYVAPWRIDLTVRDGVDPDVRLARLARTAAAALDAARAPSPASLGVILSDDVELTRLNEAHMGADGPTDVLSFPLLPPERFPPHEGGPTTGAPAQSAAPIVPAFATPPGRRAHLGDLVISVERATDQAAAGRGGQTGDVRWSGADELRLLVTHGALHICGWDHADPTEEAAMRALEQRVLAE